MSTPTRWIMPMRLRNMMRNPLMKASCNGDIKTVIELTKTNKLFSNDQLIASLENAIARYHWDVVSYFLKQGVHLDGETLSNKIEHLLLNLHIDDIQKHLKRENCLLNQNERENLLKTFYVLSKWAEHNEIKPDYYKHRDYPYNFKNDLKKYTLEVEKLRERNLFAGYLRQFDINVPDRLKSMIVQYYGCLQDKKRNIAEQETIEFNKATNKLIL